MAAITTSREFSVKTFLSLLMYRDASSWPCPTLSQNTNTESFTTSSPVKIVLFYLSEFCLIYRGMGCVAINNQLMQLCTARIAWSDSDQAVRACIAAIAGD